MAGFLVVGLGNPGARYEETRHNAGFLLIDRLVSRWGIALDRIEPYAVWGEGRIADVSVVLAKPMTFVNASGDAVRPLRDTVLPRTIVLGYDDLDLPLGQVRVRGGGGSGGHRGVASVMEAIGPDFVRIRLGIGRPPVEGPTIDHVLGRFAPTERTVMEATLARAEQGVECLTRDGLEAAMRCCNGAPPLAIPDPFR